MDKLKDYLQRRRDGLDFDTPGEELWESIRDQLPASRRPGILMRLVPYTAAACVLVAIVVGIKWLNKPQPSKATTENIEKVLPTPPVPVEAPSTPPVQTATMHPSAPRHTRPYKSKVLPENVGKRGATSPLDILEKNYAVQVQQQQDEVQRTPLYAETPAYFSGFTLRLGKIDADEKNLLEKIRRTGMDETLMDQLIRLYEEKLTLLRRLQMEMNKINRRVRPQALSTPPAATPPPNSPDI